MIMDLSTSLTFQNKQSIDEKKRLVGLDTKLRFIIRSVVPKNLLNSTITQSNAKSLIGFLSAIFEGTRVDERNTRSSCVEA